MEITREQLATRLRDTRQALGLTQAEVARRLGVHRPTVSEMEAGRRAVTSEELYRLARLYEVPVSTLLGASAEDEVERILFRKDGIAEPAARAAVRRFVRRCRVEQELETLLQAHRPAATHPGYRFRYPSGVRRAVLEGEGLAERERRRLGLGVEPLRNPLEVLERQGVRIGPLEGVADEGLDGVYFEVDGLGPCIGINQSRDLWTGFRVAFTVAHEYAHWLLDDTDAERYRPGRFTKDLKEVRANAFAAAFLMPRESVMRYLGNAGLLETDGRVRGLTPTDIVRAMDHFGVSRHALLYRLKNLGLVADAEWERVRQLDFSVTRVAEVLGLALRIEYDLDARLKELVVKAWQRGLLTTGRAAELLGVEVEVFRQQMADIGAEVEPADELLLGAAAEEGEWVERS